MCSRGKIRTCLLGLVTLFLPTMAKAQRDSVRLRIFETPRGLPFTTAVTSLKAGVVTFGANYDTLSVQRPWPAHEFVKIGFQGPALLPTDPLCSAQPPNCGSQATPDTSETRQPHQHRRFP